MAWTKLVSTAMDADQLTEMAMPFGLSRPSDMPEFPPGMKICMDEKLLERLKLEQDCEIGDMLDMRCFAVVTSVSKREVNGEAKCMVEMTIEKVAVEDEMTESTEPDDDDEED